MSKEIAFNNPSGCEKFWGEYVERIVKPIYVEGREPDEFQKAAVENNVGEFGLCTCAPGEDVASGNGMSTATAKEERYAAFLPAVHSLMSGEEDVIARMANLAALIHHEFGFWWTGFYRVDDGGVLVLGPFQGPLACTRIPFGKGVCGTAWAEDRTVVVPDVSEFPGHIACSSESKSEIVVPVRAHGRVVAVLDIDSREHGAFDSTDAVWLGKIADCIYGHGVASPVFSE